MSNVCQRAVDKNQNVAVALTGPALVGELRNILEESLPSAVGHFASCMSVGANLARHLHMRMRVLQVLSPDWIFFDI